MTESDYQFSIEHDDVCPRDLPIWIDTYPGSDRITTIRVCATCRYLYRFAELSQATPNELSHLPNLQK